MAIFKNMCITEDGMALFAKAQAGTEIKFSKMQVGSGEILDSQDPIEFTKLIDPKLDVSITSIIPNPELKSATIVGQVTNKDVVNAMYICELGLFAEDPDNGEILYGYANCGAYGDYYAPANQGPFSWQYEVAAAIGNAANVTIELSELKYDYGILNSNTNFVHVKGGNLKQINKDIDDHIDGLKKNIVSVEDDISDIKDNINNVEEDIKEISGNLSVNDEYVRDELIDIKLKLKEKELVDTINKTGIGFYDVFRDDSYIDRTKTSALYNKTDKNVRFSMTDLPTVTAQGNYTDETEIDIDQPLYVGDKLNGIEVLEVDGNEIDVKRDYRSTKPIISEVVNVISKYAPPQYLSNGWIVHTEFTRNSGVTFRVSKDFGLTWSQLCFLSGNITGATVTSKGTKMFAVIQDGTSVLSYTFDALTINKNFDMKDTITPFVIDYSQTLIAEGIHLIITPGGKLVCSYISRNTVSKGQGIKVAYSDNQGAKWETNQLIVEDGVNADIYRKSPWLILKADGGISLIYSQNESTNKKQLQFENLGSDLKSINSSVALDTYTYATADNFNPMAIKMDYGNHSKRLVCVWNSFSTTANLNNHVRLSFSDDNGKTWSTPTDLTPSDSATTATTTPTVTQNKDGKLFVIWSNQNLKSIRYTTTENFTSYSQNTDLITSSSTQVLPIAMNRVYEANIPPFIFRDTLSNTVRLFGNLEFKSANFKIKLEYPITCNLGERLTLNRIIKLDMKDQEFDRFNNINLSVYSESNKTTVYEDVDDSQEVTTNSTSREIKKGDGLFINGKLNTINELKSNLSDDSMASEILRSVNITSNNAPPMYLKNKWIVTTNYDSINNKLLFMVSKDLGLTWTKLTEWNVKRHNQSSDFATCFKDNMVYIAIQTGTGIVFAKFDATTVAPTISTFTTINGQSVERGVSIVISDSGVITVAFASPDNRYVGVVKSVNEGTVWTTMAGGTGVDLVSLTQNGYCTVYGLSLTLNAFNNPCVVAFQQYAYSNNRSYYLTMAIYNGAKWIEKNVNISNPNVNIVGYPFASINSLCQKKGVNTGRIWLVLHNKVSANTVNNIIYSFSDDGGETWSAVANLTTSTLHDQINPTLSEDNEGNIYVVWQGETAVTPNNYNIRMIRFNNYVWGDVVELTQNSSTNEHNIRPIACKSYYDFNIPLITYTDNYKVNFLSRFNSTVGYTLKLEYPITAKAGDIVYIKDLTARNGDKLLDLVGIDEEKHSFQGKRQYTTTADIQIESIEETNVTALSYSIS